MSVSYFVFYQGTTDDPEAFIAYYKTQHAALLRKFPGLEKLLIHEHLDWQDGQAVSKGKFLLVVEMIFPNLAVMESAISSKQRQAARQDFENFPAFQGEIWHQAMSVDRNAPQT